MIKDDQHPPGSTPPPTIDRGLPKKLYLQLRDILKETIDSGEWPEGAQLPTEDGLCRLFAVSKATVRLAVGELEREGRVRRRQGKGTFVSRRPATNGTPMTAHLRETLLEPGAATETRPLGWAVEAPPEGDEIPIDPGDDPRIVRLRRLSLVAGEPVLLQEIFLPHALCGELSEPEMAKLPALELLALRCGAPISAVRESFDAVALGEEEAGLLGVPAGSPALLHERTIHAGAARVLHERSLKRPGGGRLCIDLVRG